MENNKNKNNEPNEPYKSNKDFADELIKCRMILDILFCDNIGNKIIVDKNSNQNNFEEQINAKGK